MDVDVCDEVTEEFGITALPSFVLVESIINQEKRLSNKYVLNTFIGKNSPTLVKAEVQNWLSSIEDESTTLNNVDKKKESGAQNSILEKENCTRESPVDNKNRIGVQPKKKRSFTSLIFRESITESEPSK